MSLYHRLHCSDGAAASVGTRKPSLDGVSQREHWSNASVILVLISGYSASGDREVVPQQREVAEKVEGMLQ